jgi:hypothetical protein
MLDELGHGTPKMALPKRNQLVQAFGLDRQHEPLRVRVQVGAARRQLEAFHSLSAKDVAELVGEQRIPIMDQIPHPFEASVDVVMVSGVSR